jgi:hypothetical protein
MNRRNDGIKMSGNNPFNYSTMVPKIYLWTFLVGLGEGNMVWTMETINCVSKCPSKFASNKCAMVGNELAPEGIYTDDRCECKAKGGIKMGRGNLLSYEKK